MDTPAPKSVLAARRQLTAAINTFSFRLLREVAGREANCFLSPLSVYSALSMLYAAAGTSTRKAIAEVLNLPAVDAYNLGQAFTGLWEDLQSSEKIGGQEKRRWWLGGRQAQGEQAPTHQLEMANALWVNQNHPVQDEFREMIDSYYRGEIVSADFSAAGSPDRINRWVKEKTRGKIPTMVDQIDPGTILLLLNAIYFKGNWTFPFNKDKTSPDDFHGPGGGRKKVPIMHLDHAQELRYFKTGELEAVRLPYGPGRVGMYIFLPRGANSLEALLNHLETGTWRQYRSQLHTAKGRVVLPRFQLDYSVALKDTLIRMGLAPLFDFRRADFSKMIDGGGKVQIDEVQHKTFLEVNETGTEAAATTAFTAVFGSMVTPPPPFRMIVNRPFFCAIRDDHTDTLLFAGVVYDPE